MDTRPWRLPLPPNVSWFEVDKADVLAAKVSTLSSLGVQMRGNTQEANQVGVCFRGGWGPGEGRQYSGARGLSSLGVQMRGSTQEADKVRVRACVCACGRARMRACACMCVCSRARARARAFRDAGLGDGEHSGGNKHEQACVLSFACDLGRPGAPGGQGAS